MLPGSCVARHRRTRHANPSGVGVGRCKVRIALDSTNVSNGGFVSTAESWQKEQLSVAYIHAIATRAGYTVGVWNVDKDGVDVTLRSRGLMVDLQLKCTCSPIENNRGYSYPLDTKTYDKLRDPDRSAPGYLALMIAPPNVDHWILHDPKQLMLACHGYWARIQDRQDVATGDTKSITLPAGNVLDAAAMGNMFVDARQLIRRGAA